MHVKILPKNNMDENVWPVLASFVYFHTYSCLFFRNCICKPRTFLVQNANTLSILSMGHILSLHFSLLSRLVDICHNILTSFIQQIISTLRFMRYLQSQIVSHLLCL